MTELTKSSPLSGIYRMRNVDCENVAGWWIAKHFGDLFEEQKSLDEASVLVDWSHVGKISLRGGTAEGEAAKFLPEGKTLSTLQTASTNEVAVLKLTGDEFLILCQPGAERRQSLKINPSLTTLVNVTGALGCLVIAGPRRDEVWERSTAMNLSSVGPGSVVQTSVHRAGSTIFRQSGRDIILHPRELSHSLFEALMDVGEGVGLRASGIETVPVSFRETSQ